MFFEKKSAPKKQGGKSFIASLLGSGEEKKETALKRKDMEGKDLVWEQDEILLPYIAAHLFREAATAAKIEKMPAEKIGETEIAADDLMMLRHIFGDPEEKDSEKQKAEDLSTEGIGDLKGLAYLKEEDIPALKKKMRRMRKLLREAAEEITEPDRQSVKELYLGCADIFDEEQGNFLQAIVEVPYLSRFSAMLKNRVQEIRMPYQEAYRGLKVGYPEQEEKKPEAALYEKKAGEKNIHDDYMNVVHAALRELPVEYERQKMRQEGWDEKKEKHYLKRLRTEHIKTINCFERISRVKNSEQYDRFLNMPFDYCIGYHPENNRDVYRHVGMMRGEVHGIDNGWSSAELPVMGIVGGLDAQIRKKHYQLQETREALAEDARRKKEELRVAKEAESAGERTEKLRQELEANDYRAYCCERSMKELKAFAADFQQIKDMCWEKKDPAPEEKKKVLEGIYGLVRKYREEEYEELLEPCMDGWYSMGHSSMSLAFGFLMPGPVRSIAAESRELLRGMRADVDRGTRAYRDLYLALKKVGGLDEYATPEQIHQALLELENAARTLRMAESAQEQLKETEKEKEKDGAEAGVWEMFLEGVEWILKKAAVYSKEAFLYGIFGGETQKFEEKYAAGNRHRWNIAEYETEKRRAALMKQKKEEPSGGGRAIAEEPVRMQEEKRLQRETVRVKKA
ncbi:MAG: hypothetical protein IJ600_09645 [Lachnospiraceae bacterium]|nr:hypothetical protein [Lachnospiraceae bacterium]